ncbi:HAD family phosphatase [Rhodococcus jostii]|uniref:HAD family phosphatase n=1 Tax=Rhodococcus jostii TaxID=132919 RepID=A0ABU4C9B8_RHOJO|nr:HAD family phosphatase [Rhodococcus jostii]MDV6280145.1 HAD family phosphatase [Rhodococcus jostii]
MTDTGQGTASLQLAGIGLSPPPSTDESRFDEMRDDTNSPLRAVLWDMDGTLVDTEPHWMQAQRRLASEHDVEWTAADAASTVGQPMTVSAGKLQHRGIALPVATIVDMLVDDVATVISREVPWLPGAQRLLGDLAEAGIACGLVTMAYSPVAHRVAAAAPGNVFSTVVAGDDVERESPTPTRTCRRPPRSEFAPRIVWRSRIRSTERSAPNQRECRSWSYPASSPYRPHPGAISPSRWRKSPSTHCAMRTVPHCGTTDGERLTSEDAPRVVINRSNRYPL